MSVIAFQERLLADVDEIRLDGHEIDVVVGDGLVGFDEELTIDGSPIVRVSILDPARRLVASGLLRLDDDDADRLAQEVELVVDGSAYWLRQVAKRQDVFELTFEDRTVCRLRDRIASAVKVAGGTLGHRQLVARLCEQSGVPAPTMRDPGPRELEAHARVGKTAIRVAQERRTRDERREPGLPDVPPSSLRVKGAPATASQLQIAGRLLSVALDMGAGPKATLALVLAGIVESVLSNPSGGHGNSSGVLQAWVGRSRGADGTVDTVAEAMDVEYMARSFLIDKAGHGFTSKGGAMYLERTQPSMTPGEIAQAVEGSAYPDRYAEHEAEGRAIVAAFRGGGLPSGLSAGGVREAPLTVQRGESCWDAVRRVADDYGFRFFVVANRPYYLADEALMSSRPRATLSEDSPGVEWVDWEWAPHKTLRRVDLLAWAHSWQVPLGSVVLLDDSCGPAGASAENPNQGRWLVADYERSRFEQTARITLVKGRKPRVPTERVEQQLAGADGPIDAAALGDVDERVARMYEKADQIARERHGYVMGGGHGTFNGPYDCSGLVSAVLNAGGLLSTQLATGGLIVWGVPGRGRAFTVWVKDGPQYAGGGHTFIEFHTTGGSRFIEANGPAGTIAGWRTGNDTSSYSARHWSGL